MKRIKKVLLLIVFSITIMFPCACSQGNVVSTDHESEDTTKNTDTTQYSTEVKWSKLQKTGSEMLEYAEQFAIDYYEGGYVLLTIYDSGKYLIVPENNSIPSDLGSDIIVIQQPIRNGYLQATAAMDLIREIDSISCLSFVGTDRDGWYIEAAKEAFDEGIITYAGKYNAPDVEKLIAGACDIAIESTMIFHSPEIKEQLENVGIPVLVERSSYETHPFGRLEWIKVYGLLFDQMDVAKSYFDSQTEKLDEIDSDTAYEKKIAFFYVTNNGCVSVKKSGDYVSEMIQLAGGDIVSFDDATEEENALSSMTIQMEAFYANARDVDYLVYNSSIDENITDMQQLLDKNPLFADFKAVKEKHVWCTGKNMFQESTGIGDMIMDFHKILENPNVSDEELTYLHRVK